MKYTHILPSKNTQKLPVNSILNNNKKKVASLISSLSAYTKKSSSEVKQELRNIELGNLEEFEKFARIFNPVLADSINQLNINLRKQYITVSQKDISIIQNQFNEKFCEILQNDNSLKQILITYFALLINNLSTSAIDIKVRVARQLKKLRKALIQNNWNQVLQKLEKISKIENENYQKVMLGGKFNG